PLPGDNVEFPHLPQDWEIAGDCALVKTASSRGATDKSAEKDFQFASRSCGCTGPAKRPSTRAGSHAIVRRSIVGCNGLNSRCNRSLRKRGFDGFSAADHSF